MIKQPEKQLHDDGSTTPQPHTHQNTQNYSEALTGARHSFIFVLVQLGIYLCFLILNVLDPIIDSNRFVSFLLTPIFQLLLIIIVVGPLVAFMTGLNSLLRLWKSKVKERKPYLQAVVSVIFGITIMGTCVGSIVNKLIDAKHYAKKITCHCHLKILCSNCDIYQLDHERWPDKTTWCNLIKPYIEDDETDVYLCPADTIGPCSYAMNENIPEGATKLPEDLVVLFESAPGWNQFGGADDVVTNRHDEPGANIAFADGHVEFVETSDISNLRWTVDNQSVERK